MNAPAETISLGDAARPSGGRRRAALVSVAFSYANTGLAVISGLVLVPMYLHHLGTYTYGLWLASGGMVALLGAADGGLNQVVGQRMAVAAGANDGVRFSRAAAAGWVLGAGVTAVILIGGLAMATPLPRLIRADAATATALRTAFLLSVLGTACSTMQVNLFSAAHARQRPTFVGITALIAGVIGLAANVILLQMGWGIVAMGVGAMLRGTVGMVLALGYTARSWALWGVPRPTVEREEIRSQLRLTLPLLLGRMGGVLVGSGEPAIIAAAISPATAAIVVLTGRLFSLCEMIVNPLAGAVFPSIAHLVGAAPRGQVGRIVRGVFELHSVATVAAGAAALVLNETFVALWVGRERFGGVQLSIFLGFAMVASMRINFLANAVSALGDLGRPALIGLGEVLLRLALLALLLTKIGVLAMPVARLISTGLISLVPLTYLMGRILSGGTGRFTAATTGARGAVVAALIAAGWTLGVAGAQSWLGLMVQSALLGLLLMAGLIAVSPSAREQLAATLATRRTAS